MVGSGDAELIAISAALDLAMKKSTYQKQIVIFTDSQESLTTIRDGRHRSLYPWSLTRTIVTKILTRVETLEQLGVPVFLRWVPGHDGVPGNVMADRVAKYAAQNGGRDIPSPCGMDRLTSDFVIDNRWIK